MTHESILQQDNTVLVLIDVQQKLAPAIDGIETVTERCRMLLEGAKILGLPVVVTEQYPKGLGPTVPELKEALTADAQVIEKITFSCAGCDAFLDALEDLGRDQVLLCGIETHICVLQTALDLLEDGACVHVAADATGSRAPANREIALARMREAGVTVSCVESALYELLGAAGTEEFKSIARMVR